MAYAPTLGLGISRDEFESLLARGAFAEDEHVDLLDGQIMTQARQGSEHIALIQALMFLLHGAGPNLVAQIPVGAGARSIPEPDLAVIGPPNPRARPEGARLAVEVVVTAWWEAKRKLPVYAAGGVEEYWIVHEPKRTVFVHRAAAGREYTDTRALSGPDVLTVPGTEIAFTVDDLFATAGY